MAGEGGGGERQRGGLVVMSPSRAEGFPARLGSARDLFAFSSDSKNG